MAARPITITVINNTPNIVLAFTNPIAIHGTVPVISSGSGTLMPAGGQCSVYAENTGLVGPQGSFSFAFQDNSGRAFNFDYNHPYGTGTTYVNVIAPQGYAYQMTINNLPHHDASCTISLLQTATT